MPVAGSARRTLLFAHSGYLLATGLWPVLHRSSFECVTGRKTDFWLVRTVGGLAAAIGLSLGRALLRKASPPEVRLLAMGSTVVFSVADIYAGLAISRTYFADLVLQPVFCSAWFRAPAKEDGAAAPSAS